jgi:hypothetical protein
MLGRVPVFGPNRTVIAGIEVAICDPRPNRALPALTIGARSLTRELMNGHTNAAAEYPSQLMERGLAATGYGCA